MNARSAMVIMILILSATLSFAQSSAVYLEGEVAIDRAQASIGDPVPLGATVQTDAQGLVEISFRGKNVIRVGADTTFVFDPGNLQAGSLLKHGSLALVLKNLAAGGDRNFVVRTQSAVAGVRGTSFFIKAEDATTTYVCICNGVIHLDDPAGTQGRDVAAAHHQAFRLTRVGGAIMVTDAPMLYHTDDDMKKLASQIGVSIDWSKVDGPAGSTKN